MRGVAAGFALGGALAGGNVKTSVYVDDVVVCVGDATVEDDVIGVSVRLDVTVDTPYGPVRVGSNAAMTPAVPDDG